MSTWRVWRESHERYPEMFEDITADKMFVTPSGAVQFLKIVPVDPATLCGKPIDLGDGGATVPCVRVKKHKDECKAVLGKSRFSAGPSMICVRLLGSVDDVKLIS